MPGIAGIIGFRSSASTEGVAKVRTMVECMRHESFYESGFVENDAGRVAVGWLSHPQSVQLPIWNQTRDVCLILVGEEFSGPSTELDRDGRPVGSYLLDLFEQHGPGFFAQLNGWFSGLLIDVRKQTVVLFNDRFGLNRVYYHRRNDEFYFASEAKALLKVFPDLRALDPAALGELLSVGCVMGTHTLFKSINVLPPASAWHFAAAAEPKKQTYFRPESWEAQGHLSNEEFYSRFTETFTRILPKYLRQQSGLGMSLTGGLDCRMILATADLSPGSTPCYTFGGPFRDCADVQLARRLATSCGQPHQTISVGNDFLGQFLACAERTVYISDGTMDVSGAVELYVNRLARKIAPIRVTGNYGSEVMRGYVAIRPGSVNNSIFTPEIVRQAGAAAETYASAIQCQPLSFIAFKQVPWHHYSRLSVEQSQLTMRSPFLDNELVALMYQMPGSLASSKDVAFRLIAQGNHALDKVPTDRGIIYQGGKLGNRLRNGFQEFTSRAEYAYDYGMPGWLTRIDSALAPLRLERLFLGRHKFYHFRVWYRRQLARTLQEVLLDPRALGRSLFKRKSIEDMVQRHVTGRANFTVEIHQALTLELIHRSLLDA